MFFPIIIVLGGGTIKAIFCAGAGYVYAGPCSCYACPAAGGKAANGRFGEIAGSRVFHSVFVEKLKVGNVTIGTEEISSQERGTRAVSTMEITLIKED